MYSSRLTPIRYGYLLTLLVFLLLVATACTREQEVPLPPQTEAEETEVDRPTEIISGSEAEADNGPRRGGELRYLAIVDVATEAGLDPALASTQPQWIFGDVIFETLVEIDTKFNILPALAKSWEIADDGLQYTFSLREGVKFHNGREMTAEDVKYSLDRVRDPATASPRQQNFSSIESIEAPDPYTVVITLSEPFSPLLATLSHITAAIVPQEEVEKGDFANNPIGTGAFQLTEWIRDERIVVEAFPDYWQPDLPYLDRIVFTFSGDDNARVAALRSGDVDLLHQVPAQFVGILEDDPSIDIYGTEQTGLTWQHLQLNTQREPFDNVLVRQALFAALDRQEIAQAGRPGTSEPVNASFLPDWHWAALDETVWEQDYDRAMELLTEAGYPEGFSFTMLVIAGFEFQTRHAQAIQQQLEPLGIDANIQVSDAGIVLNSATSGEFDAIVLGLSPTFDPDERVQQTFVCDAGINWPRYCDPEVDELAAEARQTTDHEERAELYRELQRRLAENGAWASLYMSNNYDATQDHVMNYTYYPQFYYRSLREVWLDQ